MAAVASYVLVASALALLVPAAILLIEVAASVLVNERTFPTHARGKIAVIVPAHNEGSNLASTISDIKQQLEDTDRLVVVADNCSDNTVDVALSLGAEVASRNDLTKVGKGYALDFGLRYLANSPPETVVFIDADCRIEAGAISKLTAVSAIARRPVQALYLMDLPSGAAINHQVAQFAWRVKNWVRPLGLANMGLPCQLMGTGMAVPWDIVQRISFSTDNIVEDTKLGLDFAASGYAPIFYTAAVVTSTFPASAAATNTQRERWERGYFSLLCSVVPDALWRAIRHNNIGLLVLATDLLVPPLALLVVLILLHFVLSAMLVATTGATAPLTVIGVCLAIMVIAIGLSWLKVGRDVLPLKSFVLVGHYLLLKIKMYAGLLRKRQPARWIRTDRD